MAIWFGGAEQFVQFYSGRRHIGEESCEKKLDQWSGRCHLKKRTPDETDHNSSHWGFGSGERIKQHKSSSFHEALPLTDIIRSYGHAL